MGRLIGAWPFKPAPIGQARDGVDKLTWDVEHHPLGMRYPPEHKQRTRERIVSSAARRFRSKGSDGPAIADLMRDLQLTHGGFYRHFRSKEELFIEAFEHALNTPRGPIAAAVQQAPAEGKLKAFIDAYLDVAHCQGIADGCPMAALASELARRPRGTRAAFERAVRDRIQPLAQFTPGSTNAERESKAKMLLSGMAGTLTLARLITDEKQRHELLKHARRFYLDAVQR